MSTKCSNTKYRFVLSVTLILISGVAAVIAQTPSPTPTPNEEKWGDFDVKSRVEFGVRGRKLDGSGDKFNSDWNYRSGFRVFNSSFSLETEKGTGKLFDSLLINSSGWASDPSGHVRVSVEKTGSYRFDTNIRRIKYFNSLNNHALGQHSQNTRNNIGDFDLTIFPQSEKLSFNVGYSYGRYFGPGFWNARNYRDDFVTPANTRNVSNDFRAGVQGRLLGFRMSFTQGYRYFRDRSNFELLAPTPGNNTTDTTVYNSFSRQMPGRGNAYYSLFNATRTFAKKLDFTARVIYSNTDTESQVIDRFTGRDNNNNFVDLDFYEIFANAKRTQTRGDLGISWRATDDFTISNTFSFDQFAVNGGESLRQTFTFRNPAGVAQPTRISTSAAYRVNDFKRYTNLVEGDYQINNRVGFHLGYRFTHRQVSVNGYDRNFVTNNNPSAVNNPTLQCPFTGTGTPNPLIFCENEENSTHTFIAGMKAKPVKHWVIFWDIEKGTADNVFTRIENYEFTNFRVRNRFTFDKLSLNLSAITKNNTNPAQTDNIPPVGFGPIVRSRIFSGSFDWTTRPELMFSGGYTYTHQTAKTPIYIRQTFPPSTTSVRVLGRSEYYVRDHFAYLDVSAQPHRRLSLYAAYRISKDTGQGDRPLTNPYPILLASNQTIVLSQPENIILSYPMQLQSPEVKAAFRISDRIDWNLGYQYFNYRERFQSVQNYRVHLPYTSLTIYFGREAAGSR